MIFTNILMISIILICVLLSVLIGYDLLASFSIWLSRIHIGRWSDFSSWKSAITERGYNWIKHDPIVPRNDNCRLILWDIIRGKYASRTIQSWQIAGLIIGISAFNFQISASTIKKLIGKYYNTDNIDICLLAYSLLNIDSASEKSRKYIKEFADYAVNLVLKLKGNDLTIPYRSSNPHIRYVDTLGFVCPFLLLYSVKYAKKSYLLLAKKQIAEYKTFIHPQLKLPPHAFNKQNNCPMGVYDWGRGIGWYIFALVESRRILKEHQIMDLEWYKFLCESVIELADTISKFQKKNGGFSMFLTDVDGQYESSATVLCGLLFQDAYTISGDTKYNQYTQKVICSLMSVTKRNGAVDLCQGDTKGVGLYSSKLSIMPFVQGLTMLLSKRYVKDV